METPTACLYFGCREENKDFYYAEEWQKLQQAGVLAKDKGLVCAFSRMHARKEYVTHKLKENAAHLWLLLTQVNYHISFLVHSFGTLNVRKQSA